MESPGKFSDPFFRKAGVLYFIGAGSPPEAIKIGVATGERLFEQLREIHNTNHRDPYLLGIIPFITGEVPMRDAGKYEQQLHKQFAAIQLRRAGAMPAEWFMPTDDLLKLIAERSAPLSSIRQFPHADEILKLYCRVDRQI
ncbi:MAG TPA: GIY-YIG nuclease family protein [Terriglobales bacterium]|nr:GIY-YIG nuclease family protein [Acidobacteriaceae bacterium]HKR31128.1 GIY-YIG nuclease family protein [Terriglobales bacterium]